MSLFYAYKPGMVLGWLIALVLGGLIHVAYLGNPLRVWRMIMKPQTSELSRGIWVIGMFAVLGFFQIFTAAAVNMVFNTIMAVLCLIIISHGFNHHERDPGPCRPGAPPRCCPFPLYPAYGWDSRSCSSWWRYPHHPGLRQRVWKSGPR